MLSLDVNRPSRPRIQAVMKGLIENAFQAVVEIVPSSTIAMLVAVDENLPRTSVEVMESALESALETAMETVTEVMVEAVPICIVALLQAGRGWNGG